MTVEVVLKIAGTSFRFDNLVAVHLAISVDKKPVVLTLEPDPENQFDENAVKVMASIDGKEPINVGFIPRSDSKRANDAIREGRVKAVSVAECYIGGGGKRYGTMSIKLTVEKKGESSKSTMESKSNV